MTLPSVSTICFASSYGVALVLELSRFFFRAPVRRAIMIGFVLAGLVAQLIFLAIEVSAGRTLSSWYIGCLTLAGALAVIHVMVTFKQESSVSGLFLLTTCLALIGASQILPARASAERFDSFRFFGVLHGLSVLLGSTLVIVGFLAAVMYLVQSFRLKHKLRPKSGFGLPSLEKLHRINERSLLGSIAFLGVGLFSGVMLNLSDRDRTVPWSDPIVWASGVWLAWLVSVSIFRTVYPPSREGRKVAYLTLGSFAFLSVVLAILFFFPNHHGRAAETDEVGPFRRNGTWARGKIKVTRSVSEEACNCRVSSLSLRVTLASYFLSLALERQRTPSSQVPLGNRDLLLPSKWGDA